LIPDDIDGLISCQDGSQLPSDPNLLLYEAGIDHFQAFRIIRPCCACLLTPCGVAFMTARGLNGFKELFALDRVRYWLRKEYSTRTFLVIYPNRIEINQPQVCFPFGCFGCGSCNSDLISTHVFDRGAFGFRRVNIGINHLLCCWPVSAMPVQRTLVESYVYRLWWMVVR
jgi:hypothetical protein